MLLYCIVEKHPFSIKKNNMNNLDKKYLNIVADIIDNGTISGDRTGTGTVKKFGYFLEHKMSEGLPILTTKEMFIKGVIIELLWFLSGDTNIKKLVDNGVNIWVGDCYKRYTKYVDENGPSVFEPIMSRSGFINRIKLEKENSLFLLKHCDIGKSYSYQWRKGQVDQLQSVLDEMQRNPDSRRLLVDSWNYEQLDEMLLPPCHFAFQLFTQEIKHEMYKREISLMFHMRSSDTILGLPFNILSYGILLEMLALQYNMKSGDLKCSLGDAHVYLDQVDIFNQKQRNAESYKLPTIEINKKPSIFDYELGDFKIINYICGENIKYPLSN